MPPVANPSPDNADHVLVNVERISKLFRIYDKPADRLRQSLASRIRMPGRAPREYGRNFWALHNVSFSVKRGETIGIIGRNGSGKSTLLQIIAGTLSPTSGEIDVNGRISALLELGAGFNPEFSGRENVLLSARIMGVSGEEIAARFHEIEAFADIGEFIDQPVKTYSSGMYVRLAFAVAIHVSPDLLVVDEALAVGDTAFQTKCLTRIRDMQKAGVTILLVTHSTNTLVEYCDRAIYLKRGHLIKDGPCRDVVKLYANDLVDEEGGRAIDIDVPEGERAASESGAETKKVESDKTSILDVKITNEDGRERTTFSFDDPFRVTVSIRVSQPNLRPCFGVQLKSVDDIVLWSTTTQHMNIAMDALEPGTYHFTWSLRANFSGNRYVVAIGVGDVESGEYKRHARLPYAGHIDVLPQADGGSGWLAPCPAFDFSQ
ncbi:MULTISPECIES: ABC transporter ATP-binding protein [unclassified Caballeronia]|uniref:ABC transporter ATP-binding protein n=1 Tax=unclassified Caballeronia TaxID=2646786 RepID=UPI0028600347|nr:MULTISPECIES: ABC transporter ATP-binding protein [unclassified Caballeronia]MDR5814329.1 ABC transporter ATP-binding protein [Caballeronia sp. LZ033]MDR5820806.1 ABC transporter ATP-binding protein [Caballeronia sp. LZ043]MDR5878907.1 ABC transporter ATP-binding protein [Caballeronia sp. LZ032]